MSAAAPPRQVLVVDHHAVFAEAVAARLSQEPDLEVLAVRRARHALAIVPSRGVAAVVLEQWLTDIDGLELTRQLRALPSPPAVVFLGDTAAPEEAVAALQSGAHAWVGKDSAVEILLEALRAVLRAQMYVSPGMLGPVLQLMLHQRRSDSPSGIDALTARELDVLVCMVEGLDQVSSARQLFLSPNTVRTHRRRVLAKLGVHSSLEAVAIGRRAGLPLDGARRPPGVHDRRGPAPSTGVVDLTLASEPGSRHRP